jgi:hypothetical protein
MPKRSIDKLETIAELSLIKLKQSKYCHRPIWLHKIQKLFQNLHDKIEELLKQNDEEGCILNIIDHRSEICDAFNIRITTGEYGYTRSLISAINHKITRLELLYPWIKKYGTISVPKLIIYPFILFNNKKQSIIENQSIRIINQTHMY